MALTAWTDSIGILQDGVGVILCETCPCNGLPAATPQCSNDDYTMDVSVDDDTCTDCDDVTLGVSGPQNFTWNGSEYTIGASSTCGGVWHLTCVERTLTLTHDAATGLEWTGSEDEPGNTVNMVQSGTLTNDSCTNWPTDIALSRLP